MSILFQEKDFIEQRLEKVQHYFHYEKVTEVISFSNSKELSHYLGITMPSWIKGVGSSDKKIFLVIKEGWQDNTGGSIGEIFIHEYVHIAIENTFKGECPLWLNEGLALYFAGQIEKMDFSECQKDYDYYNASYLDPFFYIQCGYIVQKLMNLHQEKMLIKHVTHCLDFIGDSVLGVYALKCI